MEICNGTGYSVLETSMHLEITDYFHFASNGKCSQQRNSKGGMGEKN